MPYAGQSVRPLESHRFITGGAAFVDDIYLPGMHHAVVLRSLHAHATIKHIDASIAHTQSGVTAILTGADITDLAELPLPVMGPGRPVEVLHLPSHPLLAVDKVTYVGQPIAIVVGETLAAAQDAAEHLVVEYTPLPAVIEPVKAAQEKAPVIHPVLGSNVALRAQQRGGDVDTAFAQADRVVHQRFEIPRVAYAPMETRGVVAQPRDDVLTVWNATQAPHRVRAALCDLLNCPPDAIRVVAPDVGGSFGIKDCIFPEDVLIPYLAQHSGQPVKWVESRFENQLACHGRGQHCDLSVAVRRDGTILGLRATIVGDLGAYALRTTPYAPFNASRRLTGPYHVPAIDIELLGVITNKPPTGAYRGTGSPEAAFCMERALDLIARDLEMDPAEARRRNFVSPEVTSDQSATGHTDDTSPYAQTLERVLKLVNYADWRARTRNQRPGEPLLGIGLATCLKSSGASGDHRQEHARVHIDRSGEVVIDTGISPHGQGSATSFAQLAADALGVNPERVRVRHSDTAIIAQGEGTSASRGLIIGGSAVYRALQDARDKLARITAAHLSCPVDDVAFLDGSVFNRHRPDDALSLSHLAVIAHDPVQLPADMEPGLDFHRHYTLPNNPLTFGAHAVVVAVSQETGAVTILRYVAAHDCGRVINPMLVAGQFHGGIAQGIGQALTEHMQYSPEGQPLTGSFLDYALPRATRMPDLVLETVSTPSPTNPLGARGVGSVATVPAPVAVANAVLDALSGFGVRHLDMPLTPEKIWRALREQESERH